MWRLWRHSSNGLGLNHLGRCAYIMTASGNVPPRHHPPEALTASLCGSHRVTRRGYIYEFISPWIIYNRGLHESCHWVIEYDQTKCHIRNWGINSLWHPVMFTVLGVPANGCLWGHWHLSWPVLPDSPSYWDSSEGFHRKLIELMRLHRTEAWNPQQLHPQAGPSHNMPSPWMAWSYISTRAKPLGMWDQCLWVAQN